MIRRLVLLLALSLVMGSPAQALVAPTPGPGDGRIRTTFYDPNQVVMLTGVLGYQFSIGFGEGERIENVSIGDAMGWQVTPNAKATLLFIKPILAGATTNMTVVTNLRRYAFELAVEKRSGKAASGTALYGLQFLYPAPPKSSEPVKQEPPAPPTIANSAYSYEGSTQTLPSQVFDDGRATYFRFAERATSPAVFVLEDKNGESIVNSATRGDYLVVDQVAKGFVLRQGDQVTRIFNEGFETQSVGPLSPRPRVKPKSRGLFRK